MKILYLFMIISMMQFIGSNPVPSNRYYMGADKCKECHNKPETGQQYNVWLEGPHANAMKSLSSEKARAYANEHNIKDPTTYMGCLKCHSTAGNVAESAREGITIEQGVSCESCHGPGSAYAYDEIMQDLELSMKNGMIIPTRYTCEQCHNNYNPFNEPLNYEEAMMEIDHSIPETPEE